MKPIRTILLILSILIPITLHAEQYYVPDTGQTQSYTDTFGEDADYTRNPPSYTKLDANGNALSDDATSWVMVKDNVTGLIWEVKTNDGSIHDRDNSYTWVRAQEFFIAQLNSDGFGGYTDWRLPSIKELGSIVDLGRDNPTIDTNYFNNGYSAFYWSGTTYAEDTDYAWYIYFYHGTDNKLKKNLSRYYARAVRGDELQSVFQDNGDGTVTDTTTGLMWQQASGGLMNWESAIQYCEDLNFAGYSDWRLPNRKELRTLVDYTAYEPSIDANYFHDTHLSYYWSGTTNFDDTDSAWLINFALGNDNDYSKLYTSAYVHAVRAGYLVPGSFDPLDISVQAVPTSGETPLTTDLSVTVNSGEPSYTFSWNFGDGSPESTLQNPSHAYTTSGTYTATCTVTDSQNQIDSDSVVITVEEAEGASGILPGVLELLLSD